MNRFQGRTVDHTVGRGAHIRRRPILSGLTWCVWERETGERRQECQSMKVYISILPTTRDVYINTHREILGTRAQTQTQAQAQARAQANGVACFQ